ncbi:MAG: Npt1/Npt2 family nucleotide transporter [Candidatus Aminicenantes bacterium]|jgi:ATP/ADP translocase
MQNRAYRLLSRVMTIKPDEVPAAVLLFVFFFLITAPHTIIKAIRYADLLQDIGYQGLPLAYLLAAVVTGFVVVLYSKIQFKLPLQALILSSLIFFIVTGILFSFFMDRTSAFLSYLYWIWASVFVVVLMTHFGLTINNLFNPRQAKRLIGFCGSGGILGGTVGGLVGYYLTRKGLGTILLPLACGLLFVCLLVVRAIFVIQKKRSVQTSNEQSNMREPKHTGFTDCFNSVRKSRYLVLIALAVIIAVVVSTFIDFQFSSKAQDQFERKVDKQAFFALFFGLLTFFAFFLQILLTSTFLKKAKGISLLLLLTPFVLMIGSVGIAIWGISLFSVIAVKGSDESLTFSLNQSVREILYIPVELDLRYKARPFIDMFINRFAKVIAACFLFVYAFLLKQLGTTDVPEFLGITPVMEVAETKDLSWGVIGLVILWIFLNQRIYREYVGTIKQKIKRKWSRVDKDVAEKIDIQYTKQVFDVLESRERSPALYAMHLYELLEQGKLTPEIRKMISQKVDNVKMSSMGDLFNTEGASWFPEISDEKNLEDFITDIKEITSLDAYQELIKRYADKVMKEGDESEISRMELAKAIGMMAPDVSLAKTLETLIGDDSPQVVRYAIASTAKLKRKEFIPAIIQNLSHPSTREDAKAALIEYGPAALKALDRTVRDKTTDTGLKRAIISLLGEIGTQEAADVLVKELNRETEELVTDLVDALDRIRSERPGIHIPEKIPRKKTNTLVKTYCTIFIDLYGLKHRKEDEELQKTLQKTLDVVFTDIFKLLGLFHPQEDIVKAYQNLKTGTKDSVDYAVELLDNTLKREVRAVILPLIEDSPLQVRIQKFKHLLEKFPSNE